MDTGQIFSEPYSVIVGIFLAILSYRIYVVVFRIYFHRLANFPGPKLAAASTLYRAYFQCWKDGLMLEKATELHEIYGSVSQESSGSLNSADKHCIGPVVRISPNEVSTSIL